MRQRICILLVVFLLMFFGEGFAQQKPNAVSLINQPIIKYTTIKTSSITPDFYNKSLGVVCKQEYLLEKKTGIPFRIRLGSLAYVNKLEGKER